VPAHLERRKVVAIVAEADIARLLDEERPRRDPQPELSLLVRVERELVGLGRCSRLKKRVFACPTSMTPRKAA
jgi:hypothetical protein